MMFVFPIGLWSARETVDDDATATFQQWNLVADEGARQ
jgi:hypothetical protein